MKVKPGFTLRNICGENIIMAEGIENIDFSSIICLNESAAYLWQKIADLPSFTADDLTRLLCEEYEVDETTASNDAEEMLQKWINVGIIDTD